MEINGENTADMLNVEAQNKIKNSKTQLQLVVERYAGMQICCRNKYSCYHDLLFYVVHYVYVKNIKYIQYSAMQPSAA